MSTLTGASLTSKGNGEYLNPADVGKVVKESAGAGGAQKAPPISQAMLQGCAQMLAIAGQCSIQVGAGIDLAPPSYPAGNPTSGQTQGASSTSGDSSVKAGGDKDDGDVRSKAWNKIKKCDGVGDLTRGDVPERIARGVVDGTIKPSEAVAMIKRLKEKEAKEAKEVKEEKPVGDGKAKDTKEPQAGQTMVA